MYSSSKLAAVLRKLHNVSSDSAATSPTPPTTSSKPNSPLPGDPIESLEDQTTASGVPDSSVQPDLSESAATKDPVLDDPISPEQPLSSPIVEVPEMLDLEQPMEMMDDVAATVESMTTDTEPGSAGKQAEQVTTSVEFC